MAKTVVCLLVDNPTVFQWLGHQPILAWTLKQLQEVRGIDEIVCVATTPLKAQATKMLAEDDIEVLPWPATRNDKALEEWAVKTGPAKGAEVAVLLRPTTPFLPAGKIEACLHRAQKGNCSHCVPAQTVDAVKGKTRTFALASNIKVLNTRHAGVPVLQTVPISLIESIDVARQDGYTVAEALTQSSLV